jgi:isoquinoline 1-oxidoreductase beta subunit
MSASGSRRDLLLLSPCGTGLTLMVCATRKPGSDRAHVAQNRETRDDSFAPDASLKITSNNIVTVIVSKSEMGQGIHTGLAMIVADELEADWKQVRVKMAPAAEEHVDPVFGMQLTGGSTSIRHLFWPLRRAAAAAREMLLAAAAQEWGVPVEECRAAAGEISHSKSGRSATYGQLCSIASYLPVPQNPKLKEPEDFHLIGTSPPRVDIRDKLNGVGLFGIDVSVPGMLYASTAHPPSFGGRLVSFDKSAAEKVPGVRLVVDFDGGVAVCADSFTAALKGRYALKAKWDKGSDSNMDTSSLERGFRDNLTKPGPYARNDGDATAALLKAAKRIKAEYVLPYLSHAPIEPQNCTAHVQEDRCDIWCPTQNQTAALRAASAVTGLDLDRIHVHTTHLGGGFGGRLESRVIEEAVRIAKEARVPVKLLWTRADNFANDFYRPGSCCLIEGGLDKDGRLIAWHHKVAVSSIYERLYPQMVQGGIDSSAVEGLDDMDYEIQNLRVEQILVKTPAPVGFWRSVGHSSNAFTKECFIDELAHAAGADPLAFRLGLLKVDARAATVLKRAAEAACWGKPLSEGRGRGIAYHFSYGSYVAHVAEVTVDRNKGRIKVERLVCAVDCGR